MSKRIKFITAVYFLVLVGLIFLANNKGTRYLLNFTGDIPFGDKLGHFFLMGFFSFLMNLVLRAKTFQIWKIRVLLGNLLVLIIVTLEELSQMFVSGRTFDSGDLIADCLGIFVFGELARFVFERKFKNRRSNREIS